MKALEEFYEAMHDINNMVCSLQVLIKRIGEADSLTRCHELSLVAHNRSLILTGLIKQTRNHRSPVSVELASFLKGAIKGLSIEFPEIKISLSNEAFYTLNFNDIQFQNAIFNILKNSKEAGASKFHIEVKSDRISFRDNGPGLSKENLISMKEMMSTKGEGRGFGLLSLSRFCKESNWKMKLHNNSSKDYFQTGFCVEFIFS